MSSRLGAGHLLGVLDRLKDAVQDFATRADKLNTEFHARTVKERMRSQAAVGEQTRQASALVAEADAVFQTAQETAQTKFDRRKTRIGKAYQSSKEQALKRIEDRVGGHKYDLQKRMLQAERDRDTSIAAATHAFEEFRANLATEQGTLAGLEQTALRSFKGCRGFQRAFHAAYEKPEVDLTKDEQALLADLHELLGKTGQDLRRFRHRFVLHLFKFWAVWAGLAILVIPLVPVLPQISSYSVNYPKAVGAALAAFALVIGIRFLAMRRAKPLAAAISKALARGRRMHDACFEKSETRRKEDIARLKNEYADNAQTVDQELKRSLAEAGESRVSTRMASDERTVRVNTRNEQLHRTAAERAKREHSDALLRLKQASDVRINALQSISDETLQRLTAAYDANWQALEAEWKSTTGPLYDTINSSTALAQKLFPPWTAPELKNWTPPKHFADAAKFAQLNVDLSKLCEVVPKDKRLALPGPSSFSMPLCLGYPDNGSVLFETANTGHDEAIAALNNVILRLLSVAPPGRLNFSILDPVGLGQNFAGIMHMADYEEQIITNRIWTQASQIEQRLADLNEHMEKVIQMYLRNEYQTIAEYNEQAGVIAEKYHFLVVADFPVNFSETAAKRLLSIAASGARCGVYMLIHWDQRQPLPQEFMPDELRKSCVCVSVKGRDFILTGRASPGADLVLDEPPVPEMAIEFIHQVGRSSRDSSRVEVPFEQVIPPESEIWSEDTTKELVVPIGRTGATKLQNLAIGKGTCQHGLIAGKTGSGKSTLFHVIITNLALWCSPEQVEFYLVDFKKGVEFKCYASKRLPHARVVAIESDREFGLSVLQRVDDELKRRGDMFRDLGVQDIAGYKREGGKEHIPRSLLLIDEFQEFFVEDDKISQTASLLLDRIVRQGRAFGIHVLLGSQTLGGAYTVARTTLGQMVIRIALQCNEADAYLIMDDTNPAPRLLSRPGEGIYNDMAGALEGNSPFQVVWLSDEVRDSYLGKVRERADNSPTAYPGPIVFEGNAPADVRENALLRDLLAAKSVQRAAAPRIWLGAPNSIKGPTEATFHRQSGNNLLVIGQREEATLAILSIALVSLAVQHPLGSVRIILLDASPPATPQREYLERIIHSIPHPITLAKPGDLPEVMAGLATEMKSRADIPDPDAAPPVFVLIHGIQRFNRLRYEEDFGFASSDAEAAPNPAAVLNSLVTEGTRLGFHVIATCDTYNNVNRFFSRKALSEFEMRVLFQMSANDSASLIDNPKASILGLHRALFYNAQEGYLETFRPYALPGNDWVEPTAQNLARLLK